LSMRDARIAPTPPESLCDAESLREMPCEFVERPHARGGTLPESLCDAESLRETLCELVEHPDAKGGTLLVFVAHHGAARPRREPTRSGPRSLLESETSHGVHLETAPLIASIVHRFPFPSTEILARFEPGPMVQSLPVQE
jgi:hypothetical protein